MEDMIDMRPFKKKMVKDFPPDSVLRKVIVTGDDFLTRFQYQERGYVWIQLLDIEYRNKR